PVTVTPSQETLPMSRRLFLATCGLATSIALTPLAPGGDQRYAPIGKVERVDPRLDRLIPPNAAMERLADGLDWAEGPVWVPAGQYLLFSDIPKNMIWKWKDGEGKS